LSHGPQEQQQEQQQQQDNHASMTAQRTIVSSTQMTIVDNKQQEGRCKKGHRFPYYLSGTEFMRALKKKRMKNETRK
jgi:hypothetical protein